MNDKNNSPTVALSDPEREFLKTLQDQAGPNQLTPIETALGLYHRPGILKLIRYGYLYHVETELLGLTEKGRAV